jgi:hypothetical protein
MANTISRAKLAAIAAAVRHSYSHIATDSLTSLHQIKKQLPHPNLHRNHIQRDVLQFIAKAIRQSPSPIHFFKVKSHASIIGNEHVDALAKKSATIYSDIADTSIRTAGPEGNPFYNIHWLAKEDIENQTQTHNHTHATKMAHPPPPRLWYLPNHRDALQAHMHFLHKLGIAKIEANYHAYYHFFLGGACYSYGPQQGPDRQQQKRGGRSQAEEKARGSCSRRPRTRGRKTGKRKGSK